MSVANETQKSAGSSGLMGRFLFGLLKVWLGILLIVALLLGLLLTPWGTQFALNTATGFVDELSIDYHSGGVGSELHLASLRWQQENNQVEVQNLRLSLQLSCVWRLAVCIESVSAEKTRIQLKGDNTATTEEASTDLVTMPLPIFIQNLSLNDVSLNMPNKVDISWQQLSAKLDFYQRLRIEKMQLDGFSLITYDAQEQQSVVPSQPFDWTKWQYQPVTAMPIVLPIHFDILAFKMNTIYLQLAGQEKVELKKIAVKAKGNAKKLQIDEFFVEHKQGQLSAKGNVQLTGDLEHLLNLDANANFPKQPPLTLALRSSGNIHSLTTQLELNEKKASANSSSAGVSARPIKLLMDFTAKPSKADLPIKLRLDWQHLNWPLLAPEFNFDQGLVDIHGDLNALNINAQTQLAGKALPDSKITLTAIAASGAQNKRFELQELLIETLGGQVSSQGLLTFSQYIDWQGQSKISHLDPSVFWPELVADINGEINTQATNSQGVWQAKLSELDINGQWQGYPLDASGEVEFHADKGLKLQGLRVKNANNELAVDGNVFKQQALDINFKLDAPDLGNTLPQFSGALNLTGKLSGNIEQPEVIYELSASELLVSGIFVQQAQGKGELKWNKQKPVELNLELSGIQGVNNQVDKAKLVLSGNANDHQFSLTTSGQTTSVEVKIQGQLNQTSWKGNWVFGDISSSYASLTLVEPFNISADWAEQQYYIAPHCWRHSDNELCIKQAEFKQNTATWDLSLKEFDVLSVLRRLAPNMPLVQTKSRLNLYVSGDWDIAQLPHVNLSANLSAGDWVFNQQNNLQLALNEVLVKAQISPQNIVANISLSGNKIGAITASVEGQAGVFSDPLLRPIQGELLIENIDLAAFKALAPQLDVLQGGINGQARIDGTLGSPMFNGELKLDKGALKDETLPVALSGIQQSIILKGQSADFAGSYRLGQGLGKMDGDISWAPAIKGQLNVSGEQLEFDYQNMLKAKVSPNIKLMFEPNNIEIKGEVIVPYARVKVRDLPKGSISPSKDVVLVEQQEEQQASQQRLSLDLLLKLDPQRNNEVKLDAFGLTTDLQGQLRLQNNKSEVFGSGEVALVNGRYKAYGQNLVIREGDILFTSALDRPFLNIEAIRDPKLTDDGVIAGLRIEGVAQNPSVSVFSEPVMEQQQALSYILTGRGFGQSSGDSQDTVLTNALLSLGLGKSENLISKVGNKLGFEDVNIDTSGQGENTQLSLSGTIAPGVQLRYGVGVFDSVSEVAIRYELLPKLYLEAVSGVSNAIDIYYQFSIEGSQNKQVNDD